MKFKGFGTLANLGKILEDALTPGSRVREDKQEAKPKTSQGAAKPRKKKVQDPKRKAWYDKRLQEQSHVPQAAAPIAPVAPPPTASHAVTRKTAAEAGNGLLSALAAAKEAKTKDGSKRPEAWKRKPGDPIF
jgi:hypothetical protein